MGEIYEHPNWYVEPYLRRLNPTLDFWQSIAGFNHIVLSLRDPEGMDHDEWTEELLWELVQQGYEACSGKHLTVILNGYEQ